MIRFATALRDLGRFLADYGDSGVALVDAADGSAVRLAETLTAMPYYRDVERLDGAEVAFYKRAQITAADLSRRVAPPSGRTELFDDLHRLTAFADNLVPHVLRVDGVLTYEPTLAEQIDARRRLDPGSRPEIELRAAGVQAVELLAEQSGLRPMDIDEILWTRGGAPRYKAVPRHRARSVFY